MTQAAGLTNDTKVLLHYEASKKSAGVAYLFWFFLGMAGAHRFYMGRTGPAVIQLVLFILGWCTIWFVVGLIFLVPLAFWVLIDAFLIGGWVREHNQRLLTRLGV